MISKEWINRNGTLTITLIAVVLFTVFVGSFVIDPPDHLEGIVVEKIYVPSKLVVGDTPTGGMRLSNTYQCFLVTQARLCEMVPASETLS